MCEINAQCKIIRARNNLEKPFKKKESLEMFEAIGRQLKKDREYNTEQFGKIYGALDDRFNKLFAWLKWGLPLLIGIFTTLISLLAGFVK